MGICCSQQPASHQDRAASGRDARDAATLDTRFGKGAFVIGAFDQRIALTMPIESGSAGAPIFRGIPGAAHKA